MATAAAALPDEDLRRIMALGGASTTRGAEDIHASLRALIEALGAEAPAPDPTEPGPAPCGGPPLPLPLDCALFPEEPFRQWMQAVRGTAGLLRAAAARLQVELQAAAIQVVRAAQVLAEARIQEPRYKSKRERKGPTALMPADVTRVVQGLDAIGMRAAGVALARPREDRLVPPKRRRRAKEAAEPAADD